MYKVFSAVVMLAILVTQPALSVELKIIGQEFCFDVIDAVSPGSNHVMACLEKVDELVKIAKDQNELINNICLAAPDFPYSNSALSTDECLIQAKEGGYLSQTI